MVNDLSKLLFCLLLSCFGVPIWKEKQFPRSSNLDERLPPSKIRLKQNRKLRHKLSEFFKTVSFPSLLYKKTISRILKHPCKTFHSLRVLVAYFNLPQFSERFAFNWRFIRDDFSLSTHNRKDMVSTDTFASRWKYGLGVYFLFYLN